MGAIKKWKNNTHEIVDGKRIFTKQYDTWHHMMQRCYDKKIQEKYSTYVGCKVCDEWLDYDNFYEWYEANYPHNIIDIKWNLDKDILIKGNKMYSPNTCCFIPNYINTLFIKSDNSRGDLPIGITLNKENNKFRAKCNNNKGKRIHLGYYDNPTEAFQAYKTYKEKLIKQIAKENYNLGYINEKVYNALMKYEVEITD